MEYLRVRNWPEFQHYKDRSPPWIKLHTRLLSDYDFQSLPDVAKAHLMGIWMLASQLDNHIPNDPAWIASKIGAKSKIDINQLCSGHWLEVEHNDSDMLAERYPSRARGEAETEAETDPPIVPHRGTKKSNGEYSPGFLAFWSAYPRKVGKGKAWESWEKHRLESLASTITAAIGRHAQSRDWQRDGGQFIPHPSTYLSQRRWEDELAEDEGSRWSPDGYPMRPEDAY